MELQGARKKLEPIDEDDDEDELPPFPVGDLPPPIDGSDAEGSVSSDGSISRIATAGSDAESSEARPQQIPDVSHDDEQSSLPKEPRKF